MRGRGGGFGGGGRGRGFGGGGGGGGGRGRGGGAGRGGFARNNNGGEDGGAREPRVHVDRLLRSARHEHYNVNARDKKIQENRAVRDEETKRMETYRKLCEREGIQSKRLLEYDEQKRANAEQLDAAIKELDSNSRMSNKERKQAKFRLKRKASERVSELQPAVKSVGQVLARKAQKMAEARVEEQQKKEEEIQQRVAQKEEKLQIRKKKAKAFSLRTGKGQPVMAGRVKNLLDKIMTASQ